MPGGFSHRFHPHELAFFSQIFRIHFQGKKTKLREVKPKARGIKQLIQEPWRAIAPEPRPGPHCAQWNIHPLYGMAFEDWPPGPYGKIHLCLNKLNGLPVL